MIFHGVFMLCNAICDDFLGNVPFLIDSTAHHITLNILSRTYQIDDQSTHQSYSENTFENIASHTLFQFGIENEQFSTALASNLLDLERDRTVRARNNCHLRHMKHGGIGLLAYEDFQVLATDPCCSFFYEQFRQFYG